ncbi:UNVERIFIED_CONTAM: Acyltransferase-like protein, chloroplastic [Sesamum calycinum]|uniref:Acyltransferase-like protein, chloroplastic n=1 Tax=Sesamum calycinum TaxID=2727403 RepID=A0AAW2LYM6_9LAMI
MASAVKTLGLSPPPSYFGLSLEKRVHSRYQIRCSGSRDSSSTAALSSDSVTVNGAVNGVKEERKRAVLDSGNGHLSSGVERQEVDFEQEKLGPLWDDGYGSETVKDYLDYAKDIIKPMAARPGGMDGLGLGLILHHKSLGKVFDVRCMHIPVQDRTPFEELVEWVEETVRAEHSSSPNKPIYLVGDSFGGCLALAVAARNPKIDLVVILANPATSFGRSQLQPFFPLLEAMPDELHTTVPYLLSFVMGDPMKMATVDINRMLPPSQYFEQLAANLTSLLPRLSGLADIIPKETLLWKLKLLKTAAAYAKSRLHAVKAEVLILASGKDNMLPSRDEARMLRRRLQNCKVRYFKDNGHTILLEDSVNLLTIIKGTNTYRRTRNHDYVMDFVPLSMSEFEQAVERNGLIPSITQHRWFRNYAGPAMFSTTEDGKIVRGLSGVPDEGPVLLVGYHMLMGLELSPLVEEFLRVKNVMVRGIAHPTLFSHLVERENEEFSLPDYLRVYGAVPGEEYKLFWPDQPEFVRMAARFGATIVPFGVIGEDDLVELILDYDDLMKIPVWGDRIRSDNKKYEAFNVRAGMSGEVANQALYLPGLLPKIPGRLYYLFGKPIQTKGLEEMLKDREAARKVYLQIKSGVETNMSYLLQKRKEDPYRGVLDRTVYRAFHAPMDQEKRSPSVKNTVEGFKKRCNKKGLNGWTEISTTGQP